MTRQSRKQKSEQFLAGPFRRVRYAYLVEAWPPAADLDLKEACERAPAEAVIAALTREVEKYSEVIQRERGLRCAAEAQLAEVRGAVRTVFEMLPRADAITLDEMGIGRAPETTHFDGSGRVDG